jgi:hypothetical protein
LKKNFKEKQRRKRRKTSSPRKTHSPLKVGHFGLLKSAKRPNTPVLENV